ncbi:hypothetical protein [Pseudomonas mandelii]|uniref:hypothetical protein n=1 Tax=Pseudomonas mandelii TaxID=75612 RepID=UPI0012E2F926|nr:hypothetical protein [Pseudomonas mandelii]
MSEIQALPKTVEEKKNEFQSVFLAYIIFASIAAYTCQPLIKFANPSVLGTGGVLLGVCIVSLYRFIVLGSSKKSLIFCYVTAMLGTSAIFLCTNHALEASKKNDAQCLILQTKFLADNSPDEKAAAAFSALGCRPQYPEKIDYFDRFR